MHVIVMAPEAAPVKTVKKIMQAIQTQVEKDTPQGTVVIVDRLSVDRLPSKEPHANNNVVHAVLFHSGDLLLAETVEKTITSITAQFPDWQLILKESIGKWSANGELV